MAVHLSCTHHGNSIICESVVKEFLTTATDGKENANNTHFKVGKEVRDTIKRLGGTMPEDLPTPDKSIKELEREEKNKLQ